MNDQETVIRQLNTDLMDIRKHVQTLEMEKETRNAEINDYKMQINNLNEQIRIGAAEKNLNIDETLEQQRQYEARVDKIKQDMQHISNKFTTVTNANAMRHQQELKVSMRIFFCIINDFLFYIFSIFFILEIISIHVVKIINELL